MMDFIRECFIKEHELATTTHRLCEQGRAYSMRIVPLGPHFFLMGFIRKRFIKEHQLATTTHRLCGPNKAFQYFSCTPVRQHLSQYI